MIQQWTQDDSEEGRIPEPRFSYYRRCQKFRRNGKQCKAPALKGLELCYKHTEQAAAGRRYQEFREKLGMAGGVKDPTHWQRSLREVAQALVDGRIDYTTAAKLTVELQRMVGR